MSTDLEKIEGSLNSIITKEELEEWNIKSVHQTFANLHIYKKDNRYLLEPLTDKQFEVAVEYCA